MAKSNTTAKPCRKDFYLFDEEYLQTVVICDHCNAMTRITSMVKESHDRSILDYQKKHRETCPAPRNGAPFPCSLLVT